MAKEEFSDWKTFSFWIFKYFCIGLIIVIGSIFAHEVTHIFQYQNVDYKVTEICLLGNKYDSSYVNDSTVKVQQIIGWVKASGGGNYTIDSEKHDLFESQASIVQYLVDFIGVLFAFYLMNNDYHKAKREMFLRGWKNENHRWKSS